MKSYVGEIFKTTNCGDIKVKEFIGYRFEQQQLYSVEFINTGTVVEALISAIKSGQVSDPMFKSVIGIGYLGRKRPHKASAEYNRLKNIWASMLHRCYDTKAISYPNYGAKGVTVDPAWFNFAKFYDDARELPGWNLESFINRDLSLDKDKLSGETKVYSKDTCSWLTKEEQDANLAYYVRKFIVEWPDGRIEKYTKGIAAFCIDNPQFVATSISAVLNGRRKTNKGCKFYNAE